MYAKSFFCCGIFNGIDLPLLACLQIEASNQQMWSDPGARFENSKGPSSSSGAERNGPGFSSLLPSSSNSSRPEGGDGVSSEVYRGLTRNTPAAFVGAEGDSMSASSIHAHRDAGSSGLEQPAVAAAGGAMSSASAATAPPLQLATGGGSREAAATTASPCTGKAGPSAVCSTEQPGCGQQQEYRHALLDGCSRLASKRPASTDLEEVTLALGLAGQRVFPSAPGRSTPDWASPVGYQEAQDYIIAVPGAGTEADGARGPSGNPMPLGPDFKTTAAAAAPPLAKAVLESARRLSASLHLSPPTSSPLQLGLNCASSATTACQATTDGSAAEAAAKQGNDAVTSPNSSTPGSCSAAGLGSSAASVGTPARLQVAVPEPWVDAGDNIGCQGGGTWADNPWVCHQAGPGFTSPVSSSPGTQMWGTPDTNRPPSSPDYSTWGSPASLGPGGEFSPGRGESVVPYQIPTPVANLSNRLAALHSLGGSPARLAGNPSSPLRRSSIPLATGSSSAGPLFLQPSAAPGHPHGGSSMLGPAATGIATGAATVTAANSRLQALAPSVIQVSYYGEDGAVSLLDPGYLRPDSPMRVEVPTPAPARGPGGGWAQRFVGMQSAFAAASSVTGPSLGLQPISTQHNTSAVPTIGHHDLASAAAPTDSPAALAATLLGLEGGAAARLVAAAAGQPGTPGSGRDTAPQLDRRRSSRQLPSNLALHRSSSLRGDDIMVDEGNDIVEDSGSDSEPPPLLEAASSDSDDEMGVWGVDTVIREGISTASVTASGSRTGQTALDVARAAFVNSLMSQPAAAVAASTAGGVGAQAAWGSNPTTSVPAARVGHRLPPSLLAPQRRGPSFFFRLRSGMRSHNHTSPFSVPQGDPLEQQQQQQDLQLQQEQQMPPYVRDAPNPPPLLVVPDHIDRADLESWGSPRSEDSMPMSGETSPAWGGSRRSLGGALTVPGSPVPGRSGLTLPCDNGAAAGRVLPQQQSGDAAAGVVICSSLNEGNQDMCFSRPAANSGRLASGEQHEEHMRGAIPSGNPMGIVGRLEQLAAELAPPPCSWTSSEPGSPTSMASRSPRAQEAVAGDGSNMELAADGRQASYVDELGDPVWLQGGSSREGIRDSQDIWGSTCEPEQPRVTTTADGLVGMELQHPPAAVPLPFSRALAQSTSQPGGNALGSSWGSGTGFSSPVARYAASDAVEEPPASALGLHRQAITTNFHPSMVRGSPAAGGSTTSLAAVRRGAWRLPGSSLSGGGSAQEGPDQDKHSAAADGAPGALGTPREARPRHRLATQAPALAPMGSQLLGGEASGQDLGLGSDDEEVGIQAMLLAASSYGCSGDMDCDAQDDAADQTTGVMVS